MLWWLSPGEGRESLHDAVGINCKQGATTENHDVGVNFSQVYGLWPLRKLSSRNRVTPVSIQDGVYHGITFVVISMIPPASSPISAELSPITAALSRSLRRSPKRDADRCATQ